VSKGQYVATKAELARRCGISHYRLHENWQQPGRPKDHSPGRSRYEVNAYRDWIQSWKSAHNFGSRNASEEFRYRPNEREQALIDKNKISAQRERFKLQVEMSEYVPRLIANRAIETGNRILRTELLKAFQSELPPRLEGLNVNVIRKVLLAKFHELTRHLPPTIQQQYNGNGNGN
jgi:hypothetical protein